MCVCQRDNRACGRDRARVLVFVKWSGVGTVREVRWWPRTRVRWVGWGDPLEKHLSFRGLDSAPETYKHATPMANGHCPLPSLKVGGKASGLDSNRDYNEYACAIQTWKWALVNWILNSFFFFKLVEIIIALCLCGKLLHRKLLPLPLPKTWIFFIIITVIIIIIFFFPYLFIFFPSSFLSLSL